MKKRELYIGILAICVGIATVACSKKGGYGQFTATKNDWSKNGAYFLPSKVFVAGDSVAFVAFMQTQVPYYVNLKEPKGASNLKSLQQGYKNLALVLVKWDSSDPHKIIWAEPAPEELSRTFRQSLHTDFIKHFN